MKGDKNIIVHLNRLLSNELIAVNQYFLHTKIFKSWGLERLNDIEYKECLDELNHADLYARRILFLESTPILRSFQALNTKNNIEDILRMDLSLEYNSVNDLKESIKYADSVQDYVSKDLMISVLKDEETHVDFLETELNLIVKLGIPNYVQSQLRK